MSRVSIIPCKGNTTNIGVRVTRKDGAETYYCRLHPYTKDSPAVGTYSIEANSAVGASGITRMYLTEYPENSGIVADLSSAKTFDPYFVIKY